MTTIEERVETALAALETALETIQPELDSIAAARRDGPRDPATLHALRTQERKAYRKGPFAAKAALLEALGDAQGAGADVQTRLEERFGARAGAALEALVGR